VKRKGVSYVSRRGRKKREPPHYRRAPAAEGEGGRISATLNRGRKGRDPSSGRSRLPAAKEKEREGKILAQWPDVGRGKERGGGEDCDPFLPLKKRRGPAARTKRKKKEEPVYTARGRKREHLGKKGEPSGFVNSIWGEQERRKRKKKKSLLPLPDSLKGKRGGGGSGKEKELIFLLITTYLEKKNPRKTSPSSEKKERKANLYFFFVRRRRGRKKKKKISFLLVGEKKKGKRRRDPAASPQREKNKG